MNKLILRLSQRGDVLVLFWTKFEVTTGVEVLSAVVVVLTRLEGVDTLSLCCCCVCRGCPWENGIGGYSGGR